MISFFKFCMPSEHQEGMLRVYEIVLKSLTPWLASKPSLIFRITLCIHMAPFIQQIVTSSAGGIAMEESEISLFFIQHRRRTGLHWESGGRSLELNMRTIKFLRSTLAIKTYRFTVCVSWNWFIVNGRMISETLDKNTRLVTVSRLLCQRDSDDPLHHFLVPDFLWQYLRHC